MKSLVLVLEAPRVAPLPEVISTWVGRAASAELRIRDADTLMERAFRSRPVCVVMDARGDELAVTVEALRRLKSDSFTAVIPAVACVARQSVAVAELLDAGADEVLVGELADAEALARLDAMLRRARRDTNVNPTSRLPGAGEIESELGRRIAAGEPFAMCYADLDHFKEFNDRYGYTEGDRVIRMLAMILHDVVKGALGERGFVGHIGGDDFILIVPLEPMSEVCETIVETFEALVPVQYSEADRRAGYYMGKDRRGKLHRVPLMTLSIGVVTNERRVFSRPAEVSALASEMKSYAKTRSGSLFVVDRRQDADQSADERARVISGASS